MKHDNTILRRCLRPLSAAITLLALSGCGTPGSALDGPSPSPQKSGSGGDHGSKSKAPQTPTSAKNPVEEQESPIRLYRFNSARWPNQRFFDPERRQIIQRTPKEGIPVDDVTIYNLDRIVEGHSSPEDASDLLVPFVATTAIVVEEKEKKKGKSTDENEEEELKLARVIEISPDFSRVRIEDYRNTDDFGRPSRRDVTIRKAENQRELRVLVNSIRQTLAKTNVNTNPE